TSKVTLIQDIFNEICQFTDLKTFSSIGYVCKDWNAMRQSLIASLLKNNTFESFLKQKNFDPRICLFYPNVNNTNINWVSEYRKQHPLQIIIYFKALRYH